jgi:hypothetical protein
MNAARTTLVTLLLTALLWPSIAAAQGGEDEIEELPGVDEIEELPGVDEQGSGSDEIEELESLDSVQEMSGVSEKRDAKLDAEFIAHARTYSMFGAQLTEVDGDTETTDLALVIQRVRPTLDVSLSDWARLEVAYDVIPLIGASQSVGGFAVQNVGLSALRFMDFDPVLYSPDSGSWVVQHNLDRLALRLGKPGLEVQIGRQAFNHGSARMFPATDLFAPFGPGTIDTEFKRGVDGLRATAALGINHEIEAYVIAHEPDMVADPEEGKITPEEWMYLLRWKGIFPGLFDVSVFAGRSYEQPTVGFDISTDLLGAALYAESAARIAVREEQDTSVQATAGVEYKWRFGLSTTAEVYYNNLGSKAPFTRALTDPSLPRQVGELNYLGNWYAGLAAGYSWELLSVGAGYIQNLQDGSLLLTTNVGYDFAENVAVGLGGLIPIGARASIDTSTIAQNPMAPVVPQIESEFGLFPLLLFADIRLTF